MNSTIQSRKQFLINPSLQQGVASGQKEMEQKGIDKTPSAVEAGQVAEVLKHLEAVKSKDEDVPEVPQLQEVPLPHAALPIPAELIPHMTSVPASEPPDLTTLSTPAIQLPTTRERIRTGLTRPIQYSIRWLAEFCLRLLKIAHRRIHE